jgi:MFS transporter, PAT family, beta-lactamase induction signal transducer AmpG
MGASSAFWQSRIGHMLRPYANKRALTAYAFGISSGFPFVLVAATLTQWLSEVGIARKQVFLFTFVLFMYNFKFLWSPLVDSVPIPLLTRRLGQRRSWLLVTSLALVGAIFALVQVDPTKNIALFAVCAIFLGFCGATFDIVIDAFRIEIMQQDEMAVGAGMSQYGWRTGNLITSNIVLSLAALASWSVGYMAASLMVLFGLLAGLAYGEPPARTQALARAQHASSWLKRAFVAPLADFIQRQGAWLVLLFILLHKIGDTLANLSLRNFLVTLGFTKGEIQWADVNFGLLCLFVGIFVGGILYARLGQRKAVLLSLILMAVSNLSFALLALTGHSLFVMAAAVGFENFASGIGGVAVVAYLSTLCNLAFTATQFALLSAAASILGRFLTATSAAPLIDSYGFASFYILTTLAAVPGILLFFWLWRRGYVDDPASPATSAATSAQAPAEKKMSN